MVNGIVIKLLVAVLGKNIGLIVSMLIFEMIYCQNSSVDRTLIFIELFLNNFKSIVSIQLTVFHEFVHVVHGNFELNDMIK